MEGFSLNFHLLGVGIGPAAGILAYGVSRAHSLRVTRVTRVIQARKTDHSYYFDSLAIFQVGHIPTLGPSDPLTSWWWATKYVTSVTTQIV